MRQCLIYDSPEKGARLIGVEYMITPKLYDTLDQEEKKLWHSHEYEVILDFACSSFVLFIFRKNAKM